MRDAGERWCRGCQRWLEGSAFGAEPERCEACRTAEGRSCRACGKWQSWEAFGRASKGRNGHKSECRDCNRERDKRWRTTPEGREVKLANLRRNYRCHRDQRMAESREYYAANKERLLDLKRESYRQNPEPSRDRDRAYKRRIREERDAFCERWRANTTEGRNATAKVQRYETRIAWMDRTGSPVCQVEGPFWPVRPRAEIERERNVLRWELERKEREAWRRFQERRKELEREAAQGRRRAA